MSFNGKNVSIEARKSDIFFRGTAGVVVFLLGRCLLNPNLKIGVKIAGDWLTCLRGSRSEIERVGACILEFQTICEV